MKHLHIKLIGVLITLVYLTACQQGTKKTDHKPATTPVPDEVSLRVDRSMLEELRQEVPTEIRRENDELAFIRELMTTGEQEPGKIRDQFNKAVRDRRLKFDRAAKKRRMISIKKKNMTATIFWQSLRINAKISSTQELKLSLKNAKPFLTNKIRSVTVFLEINAIHARILSHMRLRLGVLLKLISPNGLTSSTANFVSTPPTFMTVEKFSL